MKMMGRKQASARIRNIALKRKLVTGWIRFNRFILSSICLLAIDQHLLFRS